MHLEIVYVEDNPAEVYILFEAIRRISSDLRLTVVSDGEAALAFLDTVQDRPCVIVLDLHLPKVGGLEVFQAVKVHPKFHRVPVVMFAEEPDRKEVRSTGYLPDLFLRKPMDLKGYSEIAQQIIDLCKSGSQIDVPELAFA